MGTLLDQHPDVQNVIDLQTITLRMAHLTMEREPDRETMTIMITVLSTLPGYVARVCEYHKVDPEIVTDLLDESYQQFEHADADYCHTRLHELMASLQGVSEKIGV